MNAYRGDEQEMSSNETKKWEEWQLTAYLLGELDPEVTQSIAAAADDPALAKELAELGVTLDSVRSLLQSEPVSSGDRDCLAKLDLPVLATRRVSEDQSDSSGQDRPFASLSAWSAWLTLAAILMIAVTLWGVRTADRQLADQRLVLNVPSIVAQPQVSSHSVDEAGQLGMSANFGDGKVEFVQDLDLVIVKGSEHDVQRTAELIEELKSNTRPTVLDGKNSSNDGVDLGAIRDLSKSAEATNLLSNVERADKLSRSDNAPIPMVAPPASSAQRAAGAGGRDGAMRGNRLGLEGGYAGVDDLYAKPLALGEQAEGLLYESRRGRFAQSGDKFAPLMENKFKQVSVDPLSTFSIDVDTASFSKARQYLLENHVLPPRDAVRVEEFINYFDYEYDGPQEDAPFGAALAATDCPWQPEHKLVRIALQATKVDLAKRPKANLVFLLDVSGSMAEPNKLPLVKETIRLLTYQLRESDRVALVVYAGAAGCVLESTPGDRQDEILSAIARLNAGGSTNGGQGIELAYRLARENFVPGGINRVILCTDGDFNVGVTNTEQLVELVAENAKSKVFLTVLGYGMGNTNDAMMEKISDRGNGVYGFVDSRQEAHRQMVKQLAGNLITVAKDVKIQVEFNPAKIAAYRLIGYENRALKNEDFNNDKKDAGEIGAGHCVTAFYQVVPVNASIAPSTPVEPLRYQPKPVDPGKLDESPKTTSVAQSGGQVDRDQTARELLAVKLRYKLPEGDESRLMTFPLEDQSTAYNETDRDFRWAAAVAEFGMLLRASQHKGNANWTSVLERATSAAGVAPDSVRAECLEMIRIATTLSQ